MGPRFKKTKRKRHFLNGGGGITKWSVRHLGLSIFCPIQIQNRGEIIATAANPLLRDPICCKKFLKISEQNSVFNTPFYGDFI